MTEEHQRCLALTKAGSQCKNNVQADSDYCHVHQNYGRENAPKVEAEVETQTQAVVVSNQLELQSLLVELNELTRELNKLVPTYAPPDYSPQGMVDLLRGNLDRFTPETVRELQSSLEGTTLDDFRDIETWKGMWFTLNYLIKLEAAERAGNLAQRLSGLPGVSTITDLKEMLADTPPEEFLKFDTWKGIWFIANYEVQNQAQSLRVRFLGSGDDS